MPKSRHRTGHRYRVARQQMFQYYGHTCHLCGHDEANDADHLEPVSLNPHQPVDPHRMRPAHGVEGCPTCGLACNQSRGNRSIKAALRTSRDW